MITTAEEKWLKEKIPRLKVNADRTEISGELNFRAAYDALTDCFTWLLEHRQTVAGETLSDTYKVLMKKTNDSGGIPILRIEDERINKCIDRHFYKNGNACLCGPVEKYDFILSGPSFIKYLERMVIPFLYEQTYYDKHEKKWPWGEYAHGAAGIFQSYVRSGKTREHIEACLQQLRKGDDWQRIRNVLSGREHVTETSMCFCGEQKQIRNCHGGAWFAMVRFRIAIRDQEIPLDV